MERKDGTDHEFLYKYKNRGIYTYVYFFIGSTPPFLYFFVPVVPVVPVGKKNIEPQGFSGFWGWNETLKNRDTWNETLKNEITLIIF